MISPSTIRVTSPIVGRCRIRVRIGPASFRNHGRAVYRRRRGGNISRTSYARERLSIGRGWNRTRDPAIAGAEAHVMIGKIGSSSERPHRPEAQDVALSRPKHGFESRWGRFFVTPNFTALTRPRFVDVR